MNDRALLDALLAATTVGSIMVAGAVAVVHYRTRWSGHLRHTVVLAALSAQLATLASFVVLSPSPLICAIRQCAAEEMDAAVASYYTWSAAGKFADLAPEATAAARSVSTAIPSLPSALVIIWMAGAVVAAAGSIRRRVRAQQIVGQAAPVTDLVLKQSVVRLSSRLGVRYAVRLATHPAISVPSVAGLIRPTLLLPPNFDSAPVAEREIVLVHELAHVRRRDMIASAIADLAVACFWFNPIVRLGARHLGDLQEIAADSTVLRTGVRPSYYAQFLVDACRAVRANTDGARLLSHALVGGCQMEERVRAILGHGRIHHEPPRALTVAVLAAFGVATMGITVGPALLHATSAAQRAQESVPLQRQLLNAASLDSIVRPLVINRMTERYVAGTAIVVVHEGRVVYQEGFGRREVFQEAPVEADKTIWRIGSVTKVLTGAAVMQLVDRGVLDLDADVNTYLREFKVAPAFEAPVRVRHLLTHTGGFDQIGLGRHVMRAADVRPLGDFLRENLVRIRRPDEVTTYDTYGITLAGYLVEQVSGLRYEEYLTRHIFAPLGMHRSGIAIRPELAGDIAVGYGFAGSWEPERWEYMNTDPASTVNATVADMGRFAMMLLEGGQYGGAQVLSSRSARAMVTRQFTNHPEQPGYGYTLFEDRSFGIPAFSHGGSMSGYGTFLLLVPQHRLGIFVATNQESGSITHPLTTALVDALFPGHGPANPIRQRLDGRIDLEKFVGRYTNSMHHHSDTTRGWVPRPFDLRSDSVGRLVFDGKPAYAVGPLSFQRDDGVLLTFRENARGQVTHLFVNQTVFERLR